MGDNFTSCIVGSVGQIFIKCGVQNQFSDNGTVKYNAAPSCVPVFKHFHWRQVTK